jgi:hypothetical protein
MAKQVINTGTVANDGTGDGLRTAFTKVNSNFTELYTQTSNTWVSPQTSNTYSVIHVSGATRVTLPAPNTASINSISNRTGTAYEVYILKTAEINSILQPIWDGDENTNEFRIFIDGNSSTGFITTYNTDEWVLLYEDGPVSYTENVSNVDISIIYRSTPQPWFDPDALGITNFRGAKLFYHAYVDELRGFNQIGEVRYAASDGLRYEVDYDSEDSRYDNQNISVVGRRSTDKLHYSNSSSPSGNLHIQWTGVVWTGRDKNWEPDAD